MFRTATSARKVLYKQTKIEFKIDQLGLLIYCLVENRINGIKGLTCTRLFTIIGEVLYLQGNFLVQYFKTNHFSHKFWQNLKSKVSEEVACTQMLADQNYKQLR